MSARVLWLASAMLASAVQASAQTPPAQTAPQTTSASDAKPQAGKAKADTSNTDSAKRQQPSKQASKRTTTVSGVTVTGVAPTYRSSIDRRSYSLSNDLQTTTGSLGDALRNIPSVQVDVQGNISLRGDPNVTILIDGKPSGMFQGQNRADALQQLPADQFDRVEVMTNPSAAFRPDGSAGIINLITKKGRSATTMGSVRANVGTDGRYNGSVSGSYNSKKLSLTGNIGGRHDTGGYEGSSQIELLDPVTGKLTPAYSHYSGRSGFDSINARGAVDYDLSSNTRLSADANYFKGDYTFANPGSYRSDAVTGPLAQDYDSSTHGNGHYIGSSESATYLRKFSGEEHEFSLRISADQNTNASRSITSYTYTEPAATTLFQDLSQRAVRDNTELKAEYKGPLPGDAKLVTGYELRIDQDSFDHQGLLGSDASDAVLTPSLTNLFKYSQTVHALYATYQRPFGRFTVMPGLRLEEALIDTDQVTSQSKDSWSYFEVYPTLHMAYKLSDRENLTVSYSRRVQRPDPQSLNPYRIYNGPLSYQQGNPRLMPEVTDSYELAYEFRKRNTYYQANLFYRAKSDSFTSVVQDIGGGALLTTQENLGRSRNGGLELVASNHITKQLSYNISGDVFWNEIDASNLGYGRLRSDFSFYGRATINWEPTKKDFVQLNINGTGRRLTPQGYSGATSFISFGYRHKFTSKLSGVMTVQDPFDMARNSSVVDTPTLKTHTENRSRVRSVFLGLTYAFGAPNHRAPEAFDFGSGGAPPH